MENCKSMQTSSAKVKMFWAKIKRNQKNLQNIFAGKLNLILISLLRTRCTMNLQILTSIKSVLVAAINCNSTPQTRALQEQPFKGLFTFTYLLIWQINQ